MTDKELTRKLLLIGNPGVQNVNYTPSVDLVLYRYKEFFKSEVGGYWTDGDNGEIIEEPVGLDRNSEVTWLTLQLRELNRDIDYSVIVFVGHGGSYLGNDQVQLSQGEILPLSCLMAPKDMESKVKRTIIIDACRSLIGAMPRQLVLESKTFSGEGQLMGSFCRDYYNKVIGSCDPHVELLQSTKYGEVAKINSNHTGTAFSDALFDTFNTKVPQWNQEALGDRCGQLNKGFTDILFDVQSRMTSYNQVPDYSRFGGSGDFPLYAVWRAVDRRI